MTNVRESFWFYCSVNLTTCFMGSKIHLNYGIIFTSCIILNFKGAWDMFMPCYPIKQFWEKEFFCQYILPQRDLANSHLFHHSLLFSIATEHTLYSPYTLALPIYFVIIFFSQTPLYACLTFSRITMKLNTLSSPCGGVMEREAEHFPCSFCTASLIRVLTSTSASMLTFWM